MSTNTNYKENNNVFFTFNASQTFKTHSIKIHRLLSVCNNFVELVWETEINLKKPFLNMQKATICQTCSLSNVCNLDQNEQSLCTLIKDFFNTATAVDFANNQHKLVNEYLETEDTLEQTEMRFTVSMALTQADFILKLQQQYNQVLEQKFAN